MLEYKLVNAQDKDMDILTSIKLVTMIDDEMDKVLPYAEKNKIKKSVFMNLERTCEEYKIIYVNNKIAGAYLVLPHEDGYIIDELYLFKEYRNKGLGTEIVSKLKKQYPVLYIWVYKNNKDTIRFLERMGFTIAVKGRTLIMKCDHVYLNIKDKLSDIRLGYRDKEGRWYQIYQDRYDATFVLQSPKQLLESKIGSSFDQVELERDLITKLGVDLRTYFIYYPDETFLYAHSFLIYKDESNYYWIENAWRKYRGSHIYKTKQELFDDILHKFVDTIPNGEFKKVKLYLYDKPRYGISYTKFIDNCLNSKSIKVK
ncbi:MAG TPA: hypothetical protein DCE23_06355 [Firmicutes bacterium]|nr:hypothetical protein [Bacillota bacterium]